MPVPAALASMGNSVYRCGQLRRQFGNPRQAQGPRAQLDRAFNVYLELAMQAKHDRVIAGHCRTLHVEPRRSQGNQVNSGDTVDESLAFYRQRAVTAAQVACAHMVQRWSGPTNHKFDVGRMVHAMQQHALQPDGFRYELSYWYDLSESYVLFHCY